MISPSLIASRYSGLVTGPRQVYSFETQAGVPVDAGNQLLRDLSPFTIRMVVPSLLNQEPAGVDVGLIGRANVSQQDNQAAADAVRSLFGVSSVSGSDSTQVLATLQQIISAGQIMSSATSTTERAVLVDATTAADIAYQVEKMLQTPPLTLLVNPNQFNRTYNSVQQYANRTRKGFIFERWGEAQVSISFSGSTGVFIAGANPINALGPDTTETTSVSGVQTASMRDSAAFQNFISLYQFYRSNGYIYDTVGKTEAHLMVGALAIDYDQFTYVGHIESFDYAHSDQSPHRIEWNMEFIVDQMFDVAQSPIVVKPHIAPQPNPAYPSRPAQSFITRPDALSGGFVNQSVSGIEQFSTAPLDLFVPSQLR